MQTALVAFRLQEVTGCLAIILLLVYSPGTGQLGLLSSDSL